MILFFCLQDRFRFRGVDRQTSHSSFRRVFYFIKKREKREERKGSAIQNDRGTREENDDSKDGIYIYP